MLEKAVEEGGKFENVLEDAIPNPEFLIKSIAEQGYSLQTALADLMDNSISANADNIEVLLELEKEPFTLFLSDNGNGMDETTLQASMQFPSKSPEEVRDKKDLGRFGLGLKTASFSQTRAFTVISKAAGEERYSGRTWDVEVLKNEGWKLIVNTQLEIKSYLARYFKLSKSYMGELDGFSANTIVIWHGLYKFEDYVAESNRSLALKKEITEITSDHLALVFHRYMERKNTPLKIRVNNKNLTPFNPFPTTEKDFRKIQYKQRNFGKDFIKMEGFVLPVRAIDEVKKGISVWVSKNMGLMEMEGVYIYRADRIILFGGWNGLIKKVPRLQLARLRVEVGNGADHLLHLNVAKSQVIVPHDLKEAFSKYILRLKDEAVREYYNRGLKKISNNSILEKDRATLFNKKASNKGVVLELNKNFSLYSSVYESLKDNKKSKFNVLMKMIETSVNNMRSTHVPESYNVSEKNTIDVDQILISIEEFKKSGIDNRTIKKDILPLLGFTFESLPEDIKKELK
jgi:hypothetical protein